MCLDPRSNLVSQIRCHFQVSYLEEEETRLGLKCNFNLHYVATVTYMACEEHVADTLQ